MILLLTILNYHYVLVLPLIRCLQHILDIVLQICLHNILVVRKCLGKHHQLHSGNGPKDDEL